MAERRQKGTRMMRTKTNQVLETSNDTKTTSQRGLAASLDVIENSKYIGIEHSAILLLRS